MKYILILISKDNKKKILGRTSSLKPCDYNNNWSASTKLRHKHLLLLYGVPMPLRTKALRQEYTRANKGVDIFITCRLILRTAAAVEPESLLLYSGASIHSVYGSA